MFEAAPGVSPTLSGAEPGSWRVLVHCSRAVAVPVSAEGVLAPCSDEVFVMGNLLVGETQPCCGTRPEVCALLKSSSAWCEKRAKPQEKHIAN